MTENQLRSRLKRKKCSVEELQAELCSRTEPDPGQAPRSSWSSTARAERSVVPAEAWWNRQHLPAVETLWVFTLKSALPYLENQHWDLLPDLPHPSVARAMVRTLDEQRWCDFNSEVAPLPKPSPPSPRTSLSPDPLGLSTSQQDLSVPDPAESPHCQTTSPQPVTTRQRLSVHSWEEVPASAGNSSAGGDEGRSEGEETGPISRQLLTDQVYDHRVPLQREGEDEEGVQRSVPGDGRGGLQSCPMCLQVFPVGFTQMDCDGHLAQCLSDMNVDMTW